MGLRADTAERLRAWGLDRPTSGLARSRVRWSARGYRPRGGKKGRAALLLKLVWAFVPLAERVMAWSVLFSR